MPGCKSWYDLVCSDELSAACRGGIRTLMITGDYQHTALAVAKDVGMVRPDAQVVVIDTRLGHSESRRLSHAYSSHAPRLVGGHHLLPSSSQSRDSRPYTRHASLEVPRLGCVTRLPSTDGHTRHASLERPRLGCATRLPSTDGRTRRSNSTGHSPHGLRQSHSTVTGQTGFSPEEEGLLTEQGPASGEQPDSISAGEICPRLVSGVEDSRPPSILLTASGSAVQRADSTHCFRVTVSMPPGADHHPHSGDGSLCMTTADVRCPPGMPVTTSPAGKSPPAGALCLPPAAHGPPGEGMGTPPDACQDPTAGLMFTLGANSQTLTASQALRALAEGRMQCALTGNSFEYILQQCDYSVLETVLRTAVVFARMKPYQKGQVMDLVGTRGVYQIRNGQSRFIQVTHLMLSCVTAHLPLQHKS